MDGSLASNFKRRPTLKIRTDAQIIWADLTPDQRRERRSRRAACVYHIINVSRPERSLRGWVWAAGLWLVQARGARVLIGRLETLGCLPRRSNEKPWPPPVSKVAKPYCNCTLSNGVSHASAPASVMTITIMLLRSLPASPSRFQPLEHWRARRQHLRLLMCFK